MKRAALIAGITIAAFSAVPTEVRAWTGDFDVWSSGYRPAYPYGAPIRQSMRPRARKPARQQSKTDHTPPIPSGPLHIIVSIDKQRATLFADGQSVASTAVSTGTADHPTPMGVFTVIQKDRHHISNLYDAPMPYMQRITWSGSALHEGPLPGYPASHGCVRLTSGFAQLLWKATKMGARVIVTRPEVSPLTFDHPRLFAPTMKAVEAPAVPVPEPKPFSTTSEPSSSSAATAPTESSAPATRVIRTADATDAVAATGAIGAKPPPAIAAPSPIIVDERPKVMPSATVKEANGRPVSVFISLKEGKLYVRQGWKALFDAPVSFEHPEQPIGTHVYTAMGFKVTGDGLRWTVISIPSRTRRTAEAKSLHRGNKKHHELAKPVEVQGPLPSPAAALDRVIIPPELNARISELITPGSSLIVSDNKLSDETGEYTDFIVLTQ
jgi:lipoprotein-anchoring transpeptidase ErfK/SrfK